MKTKTILFTMLGSLVFLLQVMAVDTSALQNTAQNLNGSNLLSEVTLPQRETFQSSTHQRYADSSLIEIAHHSEVTAKNTQGATKFDAHILMFLAAASAIFGFFSFWYSKKTAKNVVKQEINRKFQKGIFEDLIRHLYRNKVCVCATRLKLENDGFNKYYPSEEHLLKLQVLPEDLRIHRFDSTPRYYDKLHKVELYFRNYNIEVEVALEHLKTKALPEDRKKRDLDVFEMKSGFLTQEIFKLMDTMKIPISTDEIRNLLIAESKDKQGNNRQNPPIIGIPDQVSENTYYDLIKTHKTIKGRHQRRISENQLD
ncbi:MAG: hypothetical protein LBM08_01200 [Dysgonamonadaceae bacterium]|jgi:hypothetical protein|nr:hypothetical protein [Dysgonamonadaceae bacterium]